jgi:hypothetical protein
MGLEGNGQAALQEKLLMLMEDEHEKKNGFFGVDFAFKRDIICAGTLFDWCGHL